MRWRQIGPFRGGRTVAAVGVPGHPTVLYIGVNNGGMWRSRDYGRTWTPIFDDQPTGSIGAIAVAPSDPRTIYVGSGEGLQRPDLSVGDGVFKSTDGGATWRHVGLADGLQIPAIVVDPRDPNRVFVAVLGQPYGPSVERGVYRSLDGGATWQKVLEKDENTGAVDLAFDPTNSQTVFAVLWAARQAPWEIGSSWTLSASNGLYRSTDGGTTWRQIGTGLPGAAEGLGRIGLATSQSAPTRMYAVVGATKGGGLYRSDDGGEGWRLANADERLWGRDGDFNEVKVDPSNPDVVYVANVVTWQSLDGGHTFTAFRGAPGGDDYHRLWIDPGDPAVILLTGDQGAVVTVNGGETWSSWYNQPTAQFYHVATDRRFPYWVYGGQQESGSVGTVHRGNDGQITVREWHPVGAEEYGYSAPDPLHATIVYGGRVTRFDWSTGQVQDVSPEPVRAGRYRWVRTMPLLFSPLDPHVLYFGANVLFQTSDGGHGWRTISPDLTRTTYAVPENVGAFASLDPEKGKHRGVIYTVAPSPLKAGLLWVGTDDGLIHVTHNEGRTWTDVTPAALTPWSKVSLLEASRFDTLVAYAAVNRFRLADLRPHVYRTGDGGRSWTEMVRGLPANAVVNAVREAPAGRRRDDRLLPAARRGTVRARDSRPQRNGGATLLERRHRAAAGLGVEYSRLVDAPVADPRQWRGNASLRVGPALSPARRPAPRVPHRRRVPRHAARAAWSLGSPRPLHGPSHGRRPHVHARLERDHGPARCGSAAGARPAAGPGVARGGRAAARVDGVGGAAWPAERSRASARARGRRGIGDGPRLARPAGGGPRERRRRPHPAQRSARRAVRRDRGRRRRPSDAGRGRRPGMAGRTRHAAGGGGRARAALPFALGSFTIGDHDPDRPPAAGLLGDESVHQSSQASQVRRAAQRPAAPGRPAVQAGARRDSRAAARDRAGGVHGHGVEMGVDVRGRRAQARLPASDGDRPLGHVHPERERGA